MGRKASSFIAVVATVVGSLALVRLADAVGKRELMRAAREADAEAQAERLMALLEPAVILILGAIVAFIAFAVLLPMFSMEQLIAK